jgi:RimJ/RimL family protein N-acetyltransferase
MILTARLRLCPWCDDHRAPFAAMHADPEVTADLGGPFDRAESDAKLDRYAEAYAAHGLSRWAVEGADGVFLGYAGVMLRRSPGHPLGSHLEIGWRFVRSAWGQGYATESAKAALAEAFQHGGVRDILSYTDAQNLRSQAVMARLGLERDPDRDFVADYGKGPWHGMVWVAHLGDAQK